MSMRWGKTIPLYKICQVAEALPLQKVLLKIQRHRHGFLLMWLAFFLLFFCSQLLQPEVLGLAMDMKLAAAEIPATPCHVRQMLQHLEDKKQTKNKSESCSTYWAAEVLPKANDLTGDFLSAEFPKGKEWSNSWGLNFNQKDSLFVILHNDD